MVAGFLLGAYSIVGNDSIQTLGTFLARIPISLGGCSICTRHRLEWTVVLVYGFIVHDGDTSYGRLDHVPYPTGGINWLYATPPLVLLILTRFGIPVSTTFLILTVFAVSAGSNDVLGKMLVKSGLGYVVAMASGFALFLLVFKRATEYFNRTQGEEIPGYWTLLQWCSTGFLWSQWIIQDIANIFVFFPRSYVENPEVPGEMFWQSDLSLNWFIFGLASLLICKRICSNQSGGPIRKSSLENRTTDMRAATIMISSTA